MAEIVSNNFEDAANIATTTSASAWGLNYLFYISDPGAPIKYWRFKGMMPDTDAITLQVNGKDIFAPVGYARAITLNEQSCGQSGIRLYLIGKKDQPDKLVEYCLDSVTGAWKEGSLSADQNFPAHKNGILCPVPTPLGIFYQSKGAGVTGLTTLTYSQEQKRWFSDETQITLPAN